MGVIGDAWGNGDGATTFHLPDMRGRFPRGVDQGSGRDADAGSRAASNTGGNTGDNVSSVQRHQVQSHTHSWSGLGAAGGSAAAGSGGAATAGTGVIGSTGGNETRSKNANVKYMIKY